MRRSARAQREEREDERHRLRGGGVRQRLRSGGATVGGPILRVRVLCTVLVIFTALPACLNVPVCVCARVRACRRSHVCVRVRVCMCESVRSRVRVRKRALACACVRDLLAQPRQHARDFHCDGERLGVLRL